MPDKANPSDALQTVTPYFTVKDADRLIAFVTDVFGATLVKEARYEDGRIQHARLKIGDSLIMLNSATEAYPENISQMHLYVDHADRVFEQALELGATTLMAPNTRPHGDRMAGIKDPCGNVWWIASRVG